MKNWRPKGWEKCREEAAHKWFIETGSGTFAFPHFEMGADAMYQLAYEKGRQDVRKELRTQGYLPDEEK